MRQNKNHMATMKLDEVPPVTYSIGRFEGKSPFMLKGLAAGDSQVISRETVGLTNVNFVADPFGLKVDGEWFLFYEVMECNSRKGKIYLSRSRDGINWSSGELILEEAFHLSYPQVFRHEDAYYMVPESYESGEIRLYKSYGFPYDWRLERVLLFESCVDSTLFYSDDRWWMFVCDAPHDHNRLRLFFSNNLMGEWKEHPKSPIVNNDNRRSRPAGKLITYKDKLYRIAQDCGPHYGHSIKAFEIEILNKELYQEREIEGNPILSAGKEPWNRISMHHLDAHKIGEDRWIAFVDGRMN